MNREEGRGEQRKDRKRKVKGRGTVGRERGSDGSREIDSAMWMVNNIGMEGEHW